MNFSAYQHENKIICSLDATKITSVCDFSRHLHIIIDGSPVRLGIDKDGLENTIAAIHGIFDSLIKNAFAMSDEMFQKFNNFEKSAMLNKERVGQITISRMGDNEPVWNNYYPNIKNAYDAIQIYSMTPERGFTILPRINISSSITTYVFILRSHLENFPIQSQWENLSNCGRNSIFVINVGIISEFEVQHLAFPPLKSIYLDNSFKIIQTLANIVQFHMGICLHNVKLSFHHNGEAQDSVKTIYGENNLDVISCYGPVYRIVFDVSALEKVLIEPKIVITFENSIGISSSKVVNVCEENEEDINDIISIEMAIENRELVRLRYFIFSENVKISASKKIELAIEQSKKWKYEKFRDELNEIIGNGKINWGTIFNSFTTSFTQIDLNFESNEELSQDILKYANYYLKCKKVSTEIVVGTSSQPLPAWL